MDELKITLIPGDGIGPEITKSARRIVDALDIGIEWDVVEAGEAVYNKTGELHPRQCLSKYRSE